MIRKFVSEDLQHVINIWLEGNISAHNFIPEYYWESHLDYMKNILPQAEVHVYETDGKIAGFVGLDGDYIAGIFIWRTYRSQGIGKRLLDFLKLSHTCLQLSVYEKNDKALRFYEREGFHIVSESIDNATEEKEFKMMWEKSPNRLY